MVKEPIQLIYFQLIIICFLIYPSLGYGQLLDLDYAKQKREESSFKAYFIRSGIISVSSLKHIDVTAELSKLKYITKSGINLDLTIYGTETIWKGNRSDQLNTFDFLMNPIGGLLNGSFFCNYPIKNSEFFNTKLSIKKRKKWIQRPDLPNFKSSFFDNYVRLGFIYQKNLIEDPLTDSSLYFWTFPSLIGHQLNQENRIQFFNNQLNPFSYGYSLELGLEYNTQLKITLIGQQLLNTDPNGEFGLLVARLIIAYRF